jgi:hypothetical protein
LFFHELKAAGRLKTFRRPAASEIIKPLSHPLDHAFHSNIMQTDSFAQKRMLLMRLQTHRLFTYST